MSMAHLRRSSRRVLRFAAVAVLIVGMALIVGVGGQMVNAAGAEKTEGVVLRRDADKVTVRFSFGGKTYEQSDAVDTHTANPEPGDRIAIRVFRGYRGRVVSYLESRHEMQVKRDLWLIVAGVTLVGITGVLSRLSTCPDGTEKAGPTDGPGRAESDVTADRPCG
jgi:hypothetical protein